MSASVSVVLPTYNGERYIKEALDSALAQTLAPYEIIVVDDGSTDSTAEIVRGLGNKVKYIRQANKGTAGAYNTAIQVASGDYIAFLEQDDIWVPDKNALQVQSFEGREDVGMVFCPVVLAQEGAPSKSYDIDVQHGEGEYSFSDFFASNRVLNCSTVMIRTAVLQGLDGFREDMKLAFDYDLWLRIAAQRAVICLGQSLVTYRIHGSNLSRDSNELMAADGNLKALAFWADSAFARRQVGAGQLKTRLVAAHHRLAWDYSTLGQRDRELEHLWAAVKLQPFGSANWRRYLWQSLDSRMRARLAWYATRLKRAFGHVA